MYSAMHGVRSGRQFPHASFVWSQVWLCVMLGCSLPVVAQPTPEQVARLTAIDGTTGDAFGKAVALDNKTVIVGAPDADVNGKADQGAAYVFTHNNGQWTQQAKLTASDGAAGDRFGISVAIDSNTVIIGAYKQIDLFSSVGNAYVFTRGSNGAWTQQARLDGSIAEGAFGTALALEGNTAVVGARGDYRAEQGEVFVYTRSGAAWTLAQKLLASDRSTFPSFGPQEDRFGDAVAIEGSTILIGASGTDNGNGESDQGSAYIFTRNEGTWTERQKLLTSDRSEFNYVGRSVTLSGNTAVIGAYGGDISSNSAPGLAYVFVHSDSTWTERQKLTASDGADYNGFGTSLALEGNTLVAGATTTATSNSTRRVAYLFGKDSTWTETARFQINDPATNDALNVVTLEDNIALVGVPGIPQFGGSATTQGAVYVYNVPDTAAALRIDCGNRQSVTVNGKLFIPDRYVSGTSIPRTFSNTGDIANTTEDVLYQSIRSGDRFTYFIPLTNGRYNVELNFAELFFTQSGQRVFSVNIEGGATELVNFDVVAAAGGAKRAISRTFPVTVRDGNLSIAFSSQVSKAMISAIQITPASAARENVEPLAAAEEAATDKLSARPNPFTDRLTLTTETASGKVAVTVVDLLGRSVYQQVHQAQAGQIALSLPHLKAGVYVVKVQTDTGVSQTLRVVKQ